MADLKLKDLRYLVAVADTRHFGRAAERSFVSQPTLSAQLKKLEEYLGVQLIERAPKRVSLTAAGEEIVERARRIIDASDEIVELAKGHRDPLSGRLKLALLPTIGPYLLPNVAAKLRKPCRASSSCCTSIRPIRCSRNCIREKSMSESWHCRCQMDGLDSCELYKEPFMVAMPANHRLSSRATIKAEDLHDETLLLLEDGHCLRDQALDICSSIDLHEKQDFRATSLETLRQMVAAGVGITLLPELAGPRRLRQCARGRDQAVRAAGPHAHHRRRVAQVERAPRSRFSRSRSRSRRTRCERHRIHAPHRSTAGVRAECADGRELAANWFASAERRGAIVISAGTGFPQTFYFKLAAYCRRARLRRAGLRLSRHRRFRAGGSRERNREA